MMTVQHAKGKQERWKQSIRTCNEHELVLQKKCKRKSTAHDARKRCVTQHNIRGKYARSCCHPIGASKRQVKLCQGPEKKLPEWWCHLVVQHSRENHLHGASGCDEPALCFICPRLMMRNKEKNNRTIRGEAERFWSSESEA